MRCSTIEAAAHSSHDTNNAGYGPDNSRNKMDAPLWTEKKKSDITTPGRMRCRKALLPMSPDQHISAKSIMGKPVGRRGSLFLIPGSVGLRPMTQVVR